MTDFSYQLYSSRNFGPLSETLKMISELGYRQAEGFGGLYKDSASVEVLKTELGKNGLSMPTGHVGFDQIRDDSETVLSFAKALDMEAVIVPAAPERDLDAKGWEAFGAAMHEASKPYLDAGLKFGYHNHHFEFFKIDGDLLPIEIILENAGDAILELDVAWVVRGDHDPLAWIEKFGDRLLAAHVKDIAPAGECADEDGWADVGEGVLDWAGLMTALRNVDCRYFVMEHDNPSDDRRFAQRSIAAAKQL